MSCQTMNDTCHELFQPFINYLKSEFAGVKNKNGVLSESN